MTDLNFPILEYNDPTNYKENGLRHGEEYRVEIKELFEIRKELLLKKNPKIEPMLKDFAVEQLEISSRFAPNITKELKFISNGANLPIEDLVLLNNYTDFRDIELPDEGCSTIHSVNSIDCVSAKPGICTVVPKSI